VSLLCVVRRFNTDQQNIFDAVSEENHKESFHIADMNLSCEFQKSN
jgi:hypothetical protein